MMKFLLIFISLLTFNLSLAQSEYEQEIASYRTEINAEFSDTTTSILKPEAIAEFKGLPFFPANEDYNIKVKFKRITGGKVVGFATSTDRIAKYRPYGKITFKVNGKKCTLTVYEPTKTAPGYENHLFLPFKDFTNGESTYGGGRYLDLDKTEISKKFYLDFNYCYNPYCAYSNRYSCPVPPIENHLQVEIKAGVKHDGEHH